MARQWSAKPSTAVRVRPEPQQKANSNELAFFVYTTMKICASHIVPALAKPQRLQDYVPNIFLVLPSKKGMKKAILKKRVLVNGEIGTSGLFLRGGEKIDLLEDKSQTPSSFVLELKVHFEDKYLAVIEKPSGIEVSGNKRQTILNALAQNLTTSSAVDSLVTPMPAHRLDYATSGLLLIGKTQGVLTALNAYFKEKTIKKTYYAITVGKMAKNGLINTPVDDKDAVTVYEVEATLALENYAELNLVKLFPKTGRKHQLRKHLESLDRAILGDQLYKSTLPHPKVKGLHLHAAELSFTHPITHERINIKSPLLKKFTRWFPNSI